MTYEQWLASGGDNLPPLPYRPMCSATEAEASAALITWFATMELTEGESIIVMASILGRILAKRIHENLGSGIEGTQRTFELITGNIDANLNMRKDQPK